MYFITIDNDGYLTGMYDGSKDYVHRITGEPIEGAVPIPDEAFQIGETCRNMIKTAAPNTKPRWDGACIGQVALTEEDELRTMLRGATQAAVLQEEKTRIDGLSLAQLKTELGVE